MTILLLKLMLAPALIFAVSLAGRRWGPSVSGWLIGLPLTSAPVALILALGQGADFAVRAADGILAGGLSIGVFCLAYSRLAFHFDWRLSLPLSWLAFLATTFALQEMSLPAAPLLFAAVVALLIVLLLLLPRAHSARPRTRPPRWDIPVRMGVATVFVFALAESAGVLGPRLSGLLAPFPIYTTILAVFTHRLDGPAATAQFLRGCMLGLFASCAFFLVLSLLLLPAGILIAFVAATISTLSIQGTSLALLRRVVQGAAPASIALADT